MRSLSSSSFLSQPVQNPVSTIVGNTPRSRIAIFQLLAFVLFLLNLPGGNLNSASAQTLTTLVSLNGINGSQPRAGLVQGRDGNFYGTTTDGGGSTACFGSGCGTIFRMTPTGILTTLVRFNSINGNGPEAELVEGSDGNFYGTTTYGGSSTVCGTDPMTGIPLGCGTVFRMTPSGTLTTLVNFDRTNNGSNPYAGLVQSKDGDFYGTTNAGGLFTCLNFGCGAVFRMTANGTLTTLVYFDSTNSGGYGPSAELAEGSDGNFYGTTGDGGTFADGTVFRMTPSGTLTTLVNFDRTKDGGSPIAALVEGRDGNFYSTTFSGGSSGAGTVYRMTPSGILTTLVNFNRTNGRYPYADLVTGSDGNFYGTTSQGGTPGDGTVYRMTPSGILATLVNFDRTHGAGPYGRLIQGSDGNFYSTTNGGGNSQLGTVFQLSGVITTPTISSFSPTSGPVGTMVILTGTSFIGTTAVQFNGTGATSFMVDSDTQLTATVPSGATTGAITVTTAGGTATSPGTFTVNSGLPFIAFFTPSSGPALTEVKIRGINFTGAIQVKFDTTTARFVVNSSTQITATVPRKATSGKISVTTPSGMTMSNGSFTVLP